MNVIILRGIPGSGKSTWAASCKGPVIVVSADHYFNRDGKYVFRASELPAAHAQCLRQFVNALLKRDGATIVVDNTNLGVAEIAPYYQLGLAYEASVRILNFECSVEAAVERNIHGVPEHAIRSMAKRMEDERKRFPSWWEVFGSIAGL